MNRRSAPFLVSLCLLVTLLALAPSALARGAFFPNSAPPAVQISRNVSLQEAAQAGIVHASAKGGFEGDDVAVELDGKQIKAPITVSLHVEMTVESRQSPEEREAVRDLIPYLEQQTQALLNKPGYKAKGGEPINFNLDYRWREPGVPPRPEFDQVTIIDPAKDLPEPDPDSRSHVDELGVPNTDQTSEGTFTLKDLKPSILAHESLHLIGLDDRYTDVYEAGGRQIPLPESGMTPGALAAYLKSLKPPVPAPPAGEVVSKNQKGTGRCDIMGTGALLSCRKISKRDLKWLESQAGVQVEVKPGEVMLNKSDTQNLAVDYETTILAPRGGVTVAPGVSAYCIDHSKFFPTDESFDVGPNLAAVPGFAGVAKLLALNAQIQPTLAEPVLGMEQAIWNQTDGTQLENPFEPTAPVAQARELLARAGVAENNTETAPPHFVDPNAASAATGAVGVGGTVLPSIAAQTVPPAPTVRAAVAELVPNTARAAGKAQTTLVLGLQGEVTGVKLKLQTRSGHHWKSVKSLPAKVKGLQSGTNLVPLHLGRLKAGRYRVRVAVSGPSGKPAVATAALTVS